MGVRARNLERGDFGWTILSSTRSVLRHSFASTMPNKLAWYLLSKLCAKQIGTKLARPLY